MEVDAGDAGDGGENRADAQQSNYPGIRRRYSYN